MAVNRGASDGHEPLSLRVIGTNQGIYVQSQQWRIS